MQFFSKKSDSGTPKPNKKRKCDIRGSITALVVLILVPTIVIEGFLVDLARLKLYGNQAVMTADNYGESVLTVYNNILKDLYGLFAISSQNSDGSAAIESIKDYVASSFNPSSNVISFKYLQGLQGLTGDIMPFPSGYGAQARLSSGFMPYRDAQVTLSYEPITSSSLAEQDIFSTQIGDFMRFRVAQALMGGESDLMTALDNVMGMASNANVIDKKNDFDEAVDEVLTLCSEFYKLAKIFNQYGPDHVNGGDGYVPKVADRATQTYRDLKTLTENDSFKLYRKYMDNEDAIRTARAKQKNLKEGESLTQAELDLIAIGDEYDNDDQAHPIILKKWFNEIIAGYEAVLDGKVINFEGYNTYAFEIDRCADNIATAYETLQKAAAQLKASLNEPNVTSEMRTNMEEDLNRVNQLFDAGNTYSAANFIGLAKVITDQAGPHNYNGTQQSRAEKHISIMEDQRDAYLNGTTPPPNGQKIDTNGFDDFYKYTKYKTLYDNLKQMFEVEDGDDSQAKKKKTAAKNAADDAAKTLSKQETSDARDIPAGCGIGKDGKFDIENMTFMRIIDSAMSIFDGNSILEGANDLLLKLYTVIYDTSMFSCRTTNKDGTDPDQNSEKEIDTTLTGYALCREINYLYGAELEYIFGGFKDSDSNLADARNKILAFRAIVNFTASYTISSVNTAIRGISDPVKVINAPLGIALEAALRVAFAMLETVADWDELIDGGGVVLIKDQVNDMTAYDKLKDLIPGMDKPSAETKKFKMDYETYLTIMLIALTTDDQVAQRTGDLISLNVSCVEQGLDKDGKLTADTISFKMSEAYTAINASCEVKLDFVVLPQSMANMLLSGETSLLDKIQNNGFRFTVTRGY